MGHLLLCSTVILSENQCKIFAIVINHAILLAALSVLGLQHPQSKKKKKKNALYITSLLDYGDRHVNEGSMNMGSCTGDVIIHWSLGCPGSINRNIFQWNVLVREVNENHGYPNTR